jgi:hypothetical protein
VSFRGSNFFGALRLGRAVPSVVSPPNLRKEKSFIPSRSANDEKKDVLPPVHEVSMKHLLVGSICALWCIQAIRASEADTLAVPKTPEPTPAVTVPWDDLDERATTLAKQLMVKPTVQAKGPAEVFACTPEQYYWLLDNPDRAVYAWRRLGAKCVTIQRRGPGKFGYVDETGSDVTWETIHQARGVRIWFAEGKVKPSAVLPLVSVKVLVILRYSEGKTPEGLVVVKHQTEMVIHTDSKAAAAVTKMMGNSAPKLAEQGLGQMQLFFSALSSFLDRHPELVEAIFREPKAESPANTKKP